VVGFVAKVHSPSQLPKGGSNSMVAVFQSVRSSCSWRERISLHLEAGGPVAPHCVGRDAVLENASTVPPNLGQVVLTQSLDSVKQQSVHSLVRQHYQALFGLTDSEVTIVAEHVGLWAVLRRCCGCQQSQQQRAKLLGKSNATTPCDSYNLTVLEREFLATRLSRWHSDGLFSLQGTAEPPIRAGFCETSNARLQATGMACIAGLTSTQYAVYGPGGHTQTMELKGYRASPIQQRIALHIQQVLDRIDD